MYMNILSVTFLFCCVAGMEKKTIFCHMTVVITKGHNQYGPVRGVDRLRNSRLLISDPGAWKKEKKRRRRSEGPQFLFHTPSQIQRSV